MPMDYLRRIEDAAFPLTVRDEADINCSAVLLAAGYIVAEIPPYGTDLPAVIWSITALGRTELRKAAGVP